jgi:hypothetical protein
MEPVKVTGWTVPPRSGQDSTETGVEVSINGGAKVSVGRKGAESGVIVALEMAVAIRARFTGRPRIEQEARARQIPAKQMTLERAGGTCILNAIGEDFGSIIIGGLPKFVPKNPARPGQFFSRTDGDACCHEV